MTAKRPNASFPNLSPGQRALLQKKVHIDPNAWAQSDVAVRNRLSTTWSAALHVAGLLIGLPEESLHWWANHPRGHLLLTAGEEGYCADMRMVGDRPLSATALLPLRLLVTQPNRAAIWALHTLDHLLGGDGHSDALWLSDGHGRSPRWQQVGSQIASLFPLGYGLSATGQQDAHWYLAEGLWTALQDRTQLNVADPKLERLLYQSILDGGFWRNSLKAEP